MIDYKVIHSNKRTVSIKINDRGEVVVRAPSGYPDTEIRKLIDENAEKIEKSLEKFKAMPKLDDDAVAELKRQAKQVLPQRTEYYSRLMGVKPASVKINSARSHFGSCSGKNSINFSYLLMLYPPEAIGYVVVHELAHIKHHNHSAAFYEFIEKFMPDWRNREKILKQRSMPSQNG